jgi:hypothetical protein
MPARGGHSLIVQDEILLIHLFRLLTGLLARLLAGLLTRLSILALLLLTLLALALLLVTVLLGLLRVAVLGIVHRSPSIGLRQRPELDTAYGKRLPGERGCPQYLGGRPQFSGTLPMRSTATFSRAASRSRKVLNSGASR